MDQIPPFLQQGSSEDSRDEGNDRLLHVWVGKAKRLSTDSLLFYFSNVFLRLDSFLPPVIYFSNREPRVYYTE